MPPRTFLFWALFAEMLFAHAPRMALVHHVNCRTFASCVPDGFGNSYWNAWQCGRGDTHATAQEVYCQINWISLAVVGGCTALFMVGAILAYDPSRGFLARRGEPGDGGA